MPKPAQPTLRLFQHPIECPACSYYCHPQNTRCPACRQELKPQSPAQTAPLSPPIKVDPVSTRQPITSSATPQLILQLLPAGDCLTLTLDAPLVLGRAPDPTPDGQPVDLSPYKAEQHGVSRHHCLLQQQDNLVTVTDLGSTNGTYLNNERLLAHCPHPLAHQDRLILGTLHLTITTLKGD